MRQRDAQQRRRLPHGKNFIPVAQHQHHVRPVRGKIINKLFQRIGCCLGSGKRRSCAEFQDGDARRNGHAVGLYLAHRHAKLLRQMRARHHKAHGQRAALRQLFYNAAQQAVFGARARHHAHGLFFHGTCPLLPGTRLTVLFSHPQQNPALPFCPAHRTSAWG